MAIKELTLRAILGDGKVQRECIETICVDNIMCPYCGHCFDGGNATNYDASAVSAECPSCGKELSIMQSVTYTAQPMEESEDE
ncbi:hypothetical protein F1904_12810 [Akkermansia muciniphila]|nr:hypothetical protein F1904_12810 [Akkermansia muciniphila]